VTSGFAETVVRQAREPLNVLHVSTLDTGGGAASVAQGLSRGIRERGYGSWLAVGRRSNGDPDVFTIPDERRAPYRLTGYTALQRGLTSLAGSSPGRGWGWFSRSLRLATHPRAFVDHLTGNEDFGFSGTRDLLTLPPAIPTIVHCHNLHGGFFDLGALSSLSQEVPTVMTLHDSWLVTGHCAHSFECDRWQTGCGSCPDLSIYPAIRRDATATNWTRKRDIYRRSRLYVTTPSNWLMDRVEQSMLRPSIELSRVVPNGVDLSTFRPGSRAEARHHLGLPSAHPIVLLMSGRRDAPWTDSRILNRAIDIIGESKPATIFLVLGDDTNPLGSSHAQVRRVPYEQDPRRLAMYYRASDIFLHCARAATSPLSILEALACGTPAVAREVGGIGEQIRSVDLPTAATGILVRQPDPWLLARAALTLLDDEDLNRKLGENATRDAHARFDRVAHVTAYLDWYRTIIDHWKTHVRVDRRPASDLTDRTVGVAVD
jgi:glycosyltransferase involved in cell wall biosynthesis